MPKHLFILILIFLFRIVYCIIHFLAIPVICGESLVNSKNLYTFNGSVRNSFVLIVAKKKYRILVWILTALAAIGKQTVLWENVREML